MMMTIPPGRTSRPLSRATTTTRRVKPARGWREDSPPEKSADDATTTKKKKANETTRIQTTRTGKGSIESARFQRIDLLRGKRVELLMPTDVADVAEETRITATTTTLNSEQRLATRRRRQSTTTRYYTALET